jgi:hypothetical protein
VTSNEFNGAMGGLAGADELCMTAARAGNKGGTWKAWLSSSTEAAIDRMTVDGPWYQEIAGGSLTKTFNNKANFTTTPLATLGVNEQGVAMSNAADARHWTGTLSSGKASAENCVNWTNGTSANGGSIGNGYSSWSFVNESASCSYKYSLVCFEQSRLPEPAPTPTTKKRVFVTSNEFNGAMGGLAGADELCMTAARAGNKGGTWKAWLSSSTEAAIDRMTVDGPWYQEIAGGSLTKTFNNKANFTTTPLATLGVNEQGVAMSNAADARHWTGTLSSGKASAENCVNWTNGTSANGGSIGNGYSSWSFVNESASCSYQYALVCFEQ